jgi:hypothetical protein
VTHGVVRHRSPLIMEHLLRDRKETQMSIEAGDRVKLRAEWATTVAPRTTGRVKQVFRSSEGGLWARVRFDEGDGEDWIGMVRELESA